MTGEALQFGRRLLVGLLLSATVGVAEAQTAAPAALEGSYRLLAEQSDDVPQVVEQATSGRSWPVRTLMRSRLKTMLRPAPELRIELAGGQVAITAGAEPPVRVTPEAAPVPWTHPSGERMQVRLRRAGDALALTFQGRGATREQVYRLRENGRTLEVRVTLSGERLGGAPIAYSLIYARQGGSDAS